MVVVATDEAVAVWKALVVDDMATVVSVKAAANTAAVATDVRKAMAMVARSVVVAVVSKDVPTAVAAKVAAKVVTMEQMVATEVATKEAADC